MLVFHYNLLRTFLLTTGAHTLMLRQETRFICGKSHQDVTCAFIVPSQFYASEMVTKINIGTSHFLNWNKIIFFAYCLNRTADYIGCNWHTSLTTVTS